MSSYPELLDAVMDAIVTRNTAAAPRLLQDKKHFPPKEQLAVYVEGYRLRLIEVIESTYPASLFYLGKKTFKKLAEEFVEETPSRSFNIDKYPIAFAAFVARHSRDTFARDLAALESAIADVYLAEESPAIEQGWAAQLTPESLAGASLLPRTASRLLAFDFPVNAYFIRFREEKKPAKPESEKNKLLVLRHQHQVRRLPLAEGEYALLTVLAENKTLAEALEDERLAPSITGEQFAGDLMGWFARWVSEGCLRQPA